MKDSFTRNDAVLFHDAFVNSVKDFTGNGAENYILLSGGIDSLCVLYALMELGVPYIVTNFCFSDAYSVDTQSVKALQQKVGFKADWLVLDCNHQDDLSEAVRICVHLFGRVRRVKVEAIYAMLQVRKHIPNGSNVLSGSGGDNVCCWHKNDQILISKVGEDHPDVLKRRCGNIAKDEIAYVFRDMNYFDPFMQKEVTDVISKYTTHACNTRFPKSALVLSFEDMFKKYKNARKPLSFCKAAGEPQIFEDLARRCGYQSELKLFNAIAKTQLQAEV